MSEENEIYDEVVEEALVKGFDVNTYMLNVLARPTRRTFQQAEIDRKMEDIRQKVRDYTMLSEALRNTEDWPS